MTKLDQIKEAEQKLRNCTNLADLYKLKSSFIGKKSQLEQEIAGIVKLDPDKRAKKGKELNDTKQKLVDLFEQAENKLVNQAQKYPYLDLSLPTNPPPIGHMHPMSMVLDEIYTIFASMGYTIVDSGEIETDWYNFEALNIPPQHPARDMQDTFYLKNQYNDKPLVARTHTSGMQVRYLEKYHPPVKIIVPGKVYRNENEDATHCWSFYQIEGLVVAPGVSLANLKSTLETFVKAVLGDATKIRLRPSFFPYTEPSVEVDAFYQGEWLELLGAGMVHPKVLQNAGIDPEKNSGFAFGVGVERLALVKYKSNDVRHNWRPNLYFLEAF